MTKNDEIYGEHGFDRFFMVAAMQQKGAPPLTDEQQRELQPHVRHATHRYALWHAHQMAKKHKRPFVVLRSSSLAMPPEEETASPPRSRLPDQPPSAETA